MSNSINAKAQDGIFRWILKGKNAIQEATKLTLIKIGERLVDYSAFGDPSLWNPPYWPKGYVPGHFINNWQLGVDEFPVGVIAGEDDREGTAARARMRKAIPRWPVGHTYYFVNNVPYARLLETGEHSTQVPPRGMVGRVVMEFPQIVREAEIEYSKRS